MSVCVCDDVRATIWRTEVVLGKRMYMMAKQSWKQCRNQMEKNPFHDNVYSTSDGQSERETANLCFWCIVINLVLILLFGNIAI